MYGYVSAEMGEFAAESDDRIRANPINRTDPTGLVTCHYLLTPPQLWMAQKVTNPDMKIVRSRTRSPRRIRPGWFDRNNEWMVGNFSTGPRGEAQ